MPGDTPFVGEMRLFAGNFAPVGWMFCEGQLLPISEFETLFNLIGTTYGGDGQSTFALPDMRGRWPMHFGAGFTLAETGGVENVTLTASQIPNHTHQPMAASAATSADPTGNVPAQWSDSEYSTAGAGGTLLPTSIGQTGGSQPHDNLPPYVAVSFIISLFGIFPSQT